MDVITTAFVPYIVNTLTHLMFLFSAAQSA